jgi:hypothetical protein
VRELAPRLAEAEADVQRLVEANMNALLGVRFLASEYGTGTVHAGRIDSLGLDANGAPVVVECKRGTDPGVINQGLFYLSWLVDHRSEFEQLVRDKLGSDGRGRGGRAAESDTGSGRVGICDVPYGRARRGRRIGIRRTRGLPVRAPRTCVSAEAARWREHGTSARRSRRPSARRQRSPVAAW